MAPQALLNQEYPDLIESSLASIPIEQLELLEALSVALEELLEEEGVDAILPTLQAAFALGRWSRKKLS
jgi:hypothetical protein